MKAKAGKAPETNGLYFPVPVPESRFDQKNEIFKRRAWDEEVAAYARPLYTQAHFQEKYGYRKLDYALRNAAWNLEYTYAMGNLLSNHGMYSWNGVPERIKVFLETSGPLKCTPEENSRIVKKAALFFGADLAGVCQVHPNLVYSCEYDLVNGKHYPLDLPSGCRYAVVMAVAMDYGATRYSPDAIAGAATGLGYSRQAFLANLLAVFIRGLGYQAIPSGNDTALSIPLAMAAGLGELGRSGLLITQKYGPRVRICKVFTDLPLALDDIRNFGVARFCTTCRKCADRCPSQAIPFGPPATKGPSTSNHSGVKKWYIHPEKCFQFWARNWVDCSNCILVCPFNKPKGLLHDTVRFFIRHLPVLNRMMRYMDDLFGYGRSLPASRKNFWEKN